MPMAEGEKESSGRVFEGVRFAIIPSETLTDENSIKLTKILESDGAERVLLNEHGRLDKVEACTHIISTTSDFPDYEKATDSFIPVVKPLWVHCSKESKKQSNPKAFNPDPKLFFSDVVITCGDIPEGDKDAIIGGVLAMGGSYLHIPTALVTHIVALTQDDSKRRQAEKKHYSCKAVLPHWFDDCLKLGKKIDEQPYMLPDPEILNPEYSGAVFERKENHDAFVPSTKTNSEGLPDGVFPSSSPSTNRKALNVFSGQHLKLSEDLGIGPRLRDVLEELIRSGGGYMTKSISEADSYVCQYRDGSDYIRASRAGKSVGSLLWLYHIITHNTWTSPMRRLLHYPVPRDGMDCFKDLRISVSNYTGDARTYLQKLIEASGAVFTRSMGQANTHLITAHTFSEKCDAAREWNVNVVNHLWLEESYAKCQAQSLANLRYSYFPKRTNLGEVVGQTGIDREVLKKTYWKEGIEGSPKKTKANVLAYEPSPQKASSAMSSEATVRGSSSVGQTDDMDERAESTPLMTKEKRARNMTLPTRTPAADQKAPGKENETPSSGSRNAKARAVNRMHDLAPDIALYEKEAKRKGGVIYGGRRATEAENGNKEKEADRGTKRSHDESDEEEDDNEDEDETPPAKDQGRAKKAKYQLPPIDHRMLLTGANEYIEDDKKEVNVKARLRSMGILLTSNPAEASILCAPKVMRTRKFVAALAAAPLVVSTTFLDYCLKHDSPPPTARHALGNDRDTKERFGFHISQTIERAKTNSRRLLRGWTIFCTEAVKGGFDTYKEIVHLNGGQCLLWKGRASVTVTKRKPLPDAGDESQNQGGEEEEDVLYLVSGTSKEEIGLWQKFRALAEKHDMRPRIVKPDWLLVCAMAQQVEWKDEYEL